MIYQYNFTPYYIFLLSLRNQFEADDIPELDAK